ncbi:MAG: deoxyribodipyrimidine photo-lyase [Gammaproteobacteria bacterium]
MTCALLWLHRDLRLDDNPALQALLEDGHTPVPVYIHDEPDSDWPLGAASAWWLHHSLTALAKSFRQCGSDLAVLGGDSQKQLLRLVEATGAKAVYLNRRYEPACIRQEASVSKALEQRGVSVHSCDGTLLREPRQLLKKDGTPYRVFTPFWKLLYSSGPSRDPAARPQRLPSLTDTALFAESSIEALELLPAIPWDREFHQRWQPGEDGAWNTLQDFCEQRLLDYPAARDRPGMPGTSRLSAHLHFGELSALRVWHFLMEWASTHTLSGTLAATEAWLRELGWREFSYHLLYHFPDTPLQPLDERFVDFPWRTDYAEQLTRWQRGQTGIPIVDAGMRELWASGYMHNRVRMIVASLLTKNLRIPWQEGARWFWDTLVDADLANNTMGWQWTAGSGADAAPYFRIFNPVLQGEKFDSAGLYVRRWVPELERLDNKYLHRPWSADPAILADAGIRLGIDYPEPLVDLQASRKEALAAWDHIKRRPA